MASQDKNNNTWRVRIRELVLKWSGGRTLVISSAVLFLALVLSGDLSVWLAGFCFLFLTGVNGLRSIIIGEAQGLSRVPTAVPTSALDSLAGSAGGIILAELPDPVIVLDGSGRIIFGNKAAESLIGGQAKGKHVATMLRSAVLMTAIDEVLNGGGTQSVDYSLPVPVERNFTGIVTSVKIEPKTASQPSLNMEAQRRRTHAVLVVLRDMTAARRVEDMRVDFVAFASHELKTPLASLSGFIDTLRGHAKNDPVAQEEFLEIMADQAERMRRLIDDLLSLSRIELREHVRPNSRVNVLDVVRDVISEVSHLAEKYGMEITLTSPDDLPPVWGDAEELAQVVRNLVDNALRYGRTGKRVDVVLTADTRGGRGDQALVVGDLAE